MNTKITYLGYLEKDDKFYNFYPQYVVDKTKLRPFDDDLDGYIYHQNSYKINLNIGKKEKGENEEKYNEYYHNVLPEYGNKVCFISFSYEDIMHIEKQTGAIQDRLSLCDLIDSNSIKLAEDGNPDIYQVTTTPEVLGEDWYKTGKARIIAVDDDLALDKRYFLDDGKGNFIGLLTHTVINGKAGLFLPANFDKHYISDTCIELSVKNSFGKVETIRFAATDSQKFIKKDDIKNETREAKPDISKSEKNSSGSALDKTRKTLVDRIHEYRGYDRNMICNMLICMTQGFLTVFSGEPGTGKTSICDKIAQILGVSKKYDKNSRYLSISVERGWTSKNDLIGYLNPLDGVIVDVTGLHEAIAKVDKEKIDGGDYAPYFVLLDEANLSQMEYYWSNFIKLADDNARKKTPLFFAKNHTYMLPDWFKFLATINNDQTTESLSPRLLDRAWVITLPTLDDIGNEADDDNDYESVSWKALSEMFSETDADENLFKEAEGILNSIYGIYSAHEKPVSPRSKIAIEKYLKAALICFEGADKIKDAIDFIILQRLLPMLGGYISNDFKETLKVTLENYPRSSKRFEKMCRDENFANSSYVNFFM